MKYLASLPLLMVAVGVPAQEQEQGLPSPEQNVTEVFNAADKDGNGILSIAEAREALPEHEFEDSNGDGWLNHVEVEQAISGVDFDFEGSDMYTVVGEADYLEILRVVEGREMISQL